MDVKNFCIPVLLIFISCNQHTLPKGQMMINNNVVKNLDLERYLGTWYEIARFPHSFEKGLVGVTATYSLKPDGKLKVVNRGYVETLNGKQKVAEGKAKISNKDEPGKLKVAFFWVFYADYNIMELDTNYNWALIGSSSPRYLWILSRSPKMKEGTYKKLVDKAKSRGYDVTKLIRVLQP